MGFSVREAAKALNVGESTIRRYITSGKLSSERVGGVVVIPDSDVHALLNPASTPAEEAPHPDDTKTPAMPDFQEMLDTIAERLAALDSRLAAYFGLAEETKRLMAGLREKDQQLAQKDIEIERLKRELVYRERLCEKEIEDRSKVLDEKLRLMERNLQEKLDLERENFGKRLEIERRLWEEKILKEQEKFDQKIQEFQNREGFWSRLLRMMTWS